MMKNYEYFKSKKARNPSFTKAAAIKEWLSAHPDDAVDIAKTIWPAVELSTCPMTYGELCDMMAECRYDPVETLFAGYASEHLDRSDPYFQECGNGTFRSMSRDGYRVACIDFMARRGCDYVDTDRFSYDIPRELRQIIELWPKSKAGKSSSTKSRNAKASPSRKPSQARRR